MPYLIAVLMLVITGVSFTLYDPEETTEELVSSETTNIETSLKTNTLSEVTIVTEAATNTLEVDEKIIESIEEVTETLEEITTSPTPEPETIIVTEIIPEAPATPVVPPTPIILNDFADGTYTAYVDFRVPSHNYSMTVTATVADDTITDVTTIYKGRTAKDSYTRRFDKSYASVTIGQDLERINLSRIGGASLTTDAFNKALHDIELQAAT